MWQKNTYETEDVSIESLTSQAESLELTYVPKAESLYYSSGINLKADSTDPQKKIVQFVRCKVGDTCQTEYPGQYQSPQARIKVKLPLNLKDLLYIQKNGTLEALISK